MKTELMIYGMHSIEAALTSKHAKIKHIDCTENAFETIQKMKGSEKSAIQLKPIHFFDKNIKHQGVCGLVDLEIYQSLEEIDGYEDFRTILILDHLEDPQNVGSAIRHALGFNVDAVMIPKHKAAPITSVVASASAGCLFKLPIIQVTSFIQTLQNLKKQGYGLIGTSVEKSEILTTKVFWPKTAILVGNEGKGHSSAVMKECDNLVHIPLSPACQSFNAAVTAALVCYERAKTL